MNDIYQTMTQGMNYQERQKIKKQLEAFARMPEIKRDIIANYNTYIKSYVLSYFNKTYGNTNYDEQSLLDSLSFKNGNGLRPDFVYDKNKFQWSKDLKKDMNPFNENATVNYSYVTTVDTLEDYENGFKDGEMLVYSGFNNYSMESNNGEFSYYNKMTRQGAFQGLDEVYKKAQLEANTNFNSELNNNLLKKIQEKIK